MLSWLNVAGGLILNLGIYSIKRRLIMKIISNFKDYYDYMVQKYGVDPKVVYTRIQEKKEYGDWKKEGIYIPEFVKENNLMQSFEIHFCDTVYTGYVIGNMIMYDDAILNIEHVPKSLICPANATPMQMLRSWKYRRESGKRYFQYPTNPPNKPFNAKLECPIVFVQGNFMVKNPRLSDLAFGRVVEPDAAFSLIYNWHMKEIDVPNNQTDKEKIVSHGFDPITSFRKM